MTLRIRVLEPSTNILIADTFAKSAKYVETTLKILSQLPENDSVVRDLVVTQVAHLKYLIEEQAALLVSGQFNDGTARIYRTLQRHTSAFADEENLSLLRSAIQLNAAASQSQFNGQPRGNNYNRQQGFNPRRNNPPNSTYFQGGRGSGGPNRGGPFRGSFNPNRGQPSYHNWHNQQAENNFPPRRPQQSQAPAGGQDSSV